MIVVEQGKRCAIVSEGGKFSVFFKNPYMGLQPIGARLYRAGRNGTVRTPPLDCLDVSLGEAKNGLKMWDEYLLNQEKMEKGKK
jgi:hypothetical protein